MENCIENRNVFKKLCCMHMDEGHWLYQTLQIRYVKPNLNILWKSKTCVYRGKKDATYCRHFENNI